MARAFSTLYEFAQRRLHDRTDDQAVLIAKECVNNAVKMIAQSDHEYYRERGYINISAPYASGAVAVAAEGTYCSLVAGVGSWVSAYNGRMIIIANKPVHLEISIGTATSRGVFGPTAAPAVWPYDAETGADYTLYEYQHALPVNLRSMDPIRDTDFLSEVEWLNNLGEFETFRLQTNGNSGAPEVACIANGKLMLWPYSKKAMLIPISYSRWPTAMVEDTDVVDWCDDGGASLLLDAAIEYFCARETDKGAQEKLAEYMRQRDETRTYTGKRAVGAWTLGPNGGARRKYSIIGDDRED
jgi:hypothetical protein